jgi:hypothetical protein
MNKTELESLAAIRIKEAEILLIADCYQGAYYLAGYALECTLKACIAKQVKEFDFPDKKLANDSYTHKLADLVITAGLKQKLTEQERGVAIFAEAFMGIPAQQAAKITRPLMPSAAPAVLLHSLHTQQGVCNIVIAMTRRDFVKPAFSLRYAP